MRNVRPKVSLIIPVYNGEKYLKECINSILIQDFSNFEVICVDDGSNDSTASILNQFSKQDSRVRVFHIENSGVSSARNKGIKEARGNYLGFVDADDTVNQGFIKEIVNIARKQNPDMVIFGGSTFPKIQPWAESHLNPKERVYNNDCWRILFEENASKPFSFNKIFRKDLIKNKVFFDKDIKIGEDQAFMFDSIPLCKKIVCIDKKFYNYRIHSNSVMSKVNSDIHYKMTEHKKFVEHVIKNWLRNNWCNDKSVPFLAEWVINEFKYDLNSLGFNFKQQICTFIINQINLFCPEHLLNDESKKIMKTIQETSIAEWNPVISVIMPLYNSESYLNETMKCLFQQTFKDFEMILVDDGSSDNTLELLKMYAEYDSRITVLSQEHKFAGAARNLGIKYAKGEYLLFLDSDDFFAPKMLEKSLMRIKETNAEICVFRADKINQQTKQKSNMEWTCRAERCALGVDKCFSKDTNSKHIFDFTIPAPWNKLIKKSFVIDNHLEFQQTRSANDLAFIFTALATAKKITAMNDVLLTYRVNNKASLQGSQDKKPDAFYDALKELKARLIANGVYESVKKAFINFALDFCFYNLGTLKNPISYEKIHYLIFNEALDFIEAKDKDKDYFYAYVPNKIYEKMIDIQNLSLIDYAAKWNFNIVEQTNLYKNLISQKNQKVRSYNAHYDLKRFFSRGILQSKMRTTIKMIKSIGFTKTVKYAMERIKYTA